MEPADGNKRAGIHGSAQPEIRHNFRKEYIIVHGSAAGSHATFEQGITSADFAFTILPNGTVIQNFDEKLGQGAAGPYAAINGDPLANFKGIAIEFTLPVDKNYKGANPEVINPNPHQLTAGKRLINYLQKKYNIPPRNVSTSFLTVSNEGKTIPGAHGDTHTWIKKPNMLIAMGLNPEALKEQKRVPEFINSDAEKKFLESVEERIILAMQQSKKHPKYRGSCNRAIRYWQKLLINYNSIFSQNRVVIASIMRNLDNKYSRP